MILSCNFIEKPIKLEKLFGIKKAEIHLTQFWEQVQSLLASRTHTCNKCRNREGYDYLISYKLKLKCKLIVDKKKKTNQHAAKFKRQ